MNWNNQIILCIRFLMHPLFTVSEIQLKTTGFYRLKKYAASNILYVKIFIYLRNNIYYLIAILSKYITYFYKINEI